MAVELEASSGPLQATTALDSGGGTHSDRGGARFWRRPPLTVTASLPNSDACGQLDGEGGERLQERMVATMASLGLAIFSKGEGRLFLCTISEAV